MLLTILFGNSSYFIIQITIHYISLIKRCRYYQCDTILPDCLIHRQYRRECLLATKYDLNLELDYLDDFSEDNPKNYQIWHHRRSVVEVLGNGSRELQFCNNVFWIDPKNYHCWAHRYVWHIIDDMM